MTIKNALPSPSRRRVLTWGTCAALMAALPTTIAHAATPVRADETMRRLRGLEREHSLRLGVYGRNLATGQTVRYRASERFPICSVYKPVSAAAVLRDLDCDGTFLAKRIHYTQQDVTQAGFAPITSMPDNLANGMTVAQLCSAAVSYSDNAAANLLLRLLGGPQAVTRFCRSTGDHITRLDRYEPELNSAEPGRATDTTTPHAIGDTYAHLIDGNVLTFPKRRLLTDWMLMSHTVEKLKAGLPSDWTIADKTGGGNYGTSNDVGITWPPHQPPIVMSVLTTKTELTAPGDNTVISQTATLLARALQ
ncbi:class A beta-lactamase [Streptomyces sp. NPDC057910]|uniref:class A beta-lactamase n=1 Tax=Streptomyces sp. NPDC057910 TaxID=3346278 RepID=UPI0036E7AC77